MGLVSGTGLIIIHLFLLYLAWASHPTDSPHQQPLLPPVISDASAGRHGATTLKVRGEPTAAFFFC